MNPNSILPFKLETTFFLDYEMVNCMITFARNGRKYEYFWV
jgi:hypothetical protein